MTALLAFVCLLLSFYVPLLFGCSFSAFFQIFRRFFSSILTFVWQFYSEYFYWLLNSASCMFSVNLKHYFACIHIPTHMCKDQLMSNDIDSIPEFSLNCIMVGRSTKHLHIGFIQKLQRILEILQKAKWLKLKS